RGFRGEFGPERPRGHAPDRVGAEERPQRGHAAAPGAVITPERRRAMPDTTTPTAPPTVSRDALRIVLFGMPAAGKSSLLGALGEAAQAQEHLLHGRLADLSHGIAELRQRLYDESPRRTVEEIVPYPVAFEPFADPHDGGPRAEALLIDCDGRVANDLLV